MRTVYAGASESMASVYLAMVKLLVAHSLFAILSSTPVTIPEHTSAFISYSLAFTSIIIIIVVPDEGDGKSRNEVDVFDFTPLTKMLP